MQRLRPRRSEDESDYSPSTDQGKPQSRIAVACLLVKKSLPLVLGSLLEVAGEPILAVLAVCLNQRRQQGDYVELTSSLMAFCIALTFINVFYVPFLNGGLTHVILFRLYKILAENGSLSTNRIAMDSFRYIYERKAIEACLGWKRRTGWKYAIFGASVLPIGLMCLVGQLLRLITIPFEEGSLGYASNRLLLQKTRTCAYMLVPWIIIKSLLEREKTFACAFGCQGFMLFNQLVFGLGSQVALIYTLVVRFPQSVAKLFGANTASDYKTQLVSVMIALNLSTLLQLLVAQIYNSNRFQISTSRSPQRKSQKVVRFRTSPSLAEGSNPQGIPKDDLQALSETVDGSSDETTRDGDHDFKLFVIATYRVLIQQLPKYYIYLLAFCLDWNEQLTCLLLLVTLGNTLQAISSQVSNVATSFMSNEIDQANASLARLYASTSFSIVFFTQVVVSFLLVFFGDEVIAGVVPQTDLEVVRRLFSRWSLLFALTLFTDTVNSMVASMLLSLGFHKREILLRTGFAVFAIILATLLVTVFDMGIRGLLLGLQVSYFLQLILNVLKVMMLNWDEISYEIYARDDVSTLGQLSHSAGLGNGWTVRIANELHPSSPKSRPTPLHDNPTQLRRIHSKTRKKVSIMF